MWNDFYPYTSYNVKNSNLIGVKYLTNFFLFENSLPTVSPQMHSVFLQIHFGIWRNTYFEIRNSLWNWAERQSSSVKLSPSSTLSPTISTQTSSPPKLQSRKVRGTQLVSMVNFHKNIFHTPFISHPSLIIALPRQ